MLKQLMEQLVLPVTDPVGICTLLAERRVERREARRNRANAISHLRVAFLSYGSDEQLDLFAQTKETPLAVSAVSTQAFCRDVAITWTDRQIVALCDGIIQSSLEALNTFTNRERRRELLTWFSPSSDPTETLSFAFCCHVAGLNPEPIYTRVWREFRSEIRGYLAEDEKPTVDERQVALAFA